MLLDFITRDTGRMLSETWKNFKFDEHRKENLFRGLAKIMLSLARLPHDHIGSLQFHDGGYISLAARPLFCTNVLLENEGAPKIVRNTYSRSYTFISDMLKFRDEAFASQPNAVHNEDDCRLQMSYAVTLKALMSSMVNDHYGGPFVLQHSDLHASNIFVDEDWNITGLIDLEYVCALPPEMLGVPYWLSADYIDQVANNMREYTETFAAFMRIFDEEQQLMQMRHQVSIGAEIRKAWRSGAYWFYHCLTSVNAMTSIVEDHIHPKFGFRASSSTQEREFNHALSHFWAENASDWVEKKVEDKRQYDLDVQAYFKSKLV